MSATLASLSASWPLPMPADIAGAYAKSYSQAFPGCDPDQPNSFMAVQARVHGLVGFNLYLYQRSLADELMADTARTWLSRHAAQWGVPQIAATAAIGNVIFSGQPGLQIPSGVEVVAGDGTQWITTVPGAVGSDGSVSLACVAEAAGTAGNVAAGATLTVISPIVGLQNQTVTVDQDGIAGGNDAESVDDWRARILLRIRKRGQAGNSDDYVQWAEAAGAAASPNIIPGYAGPATVGVVIAMPNPAGADRLVPTADQVAAVIAAINEVRPVTDQPVGVPAAQLVQPITLALNPDTVVGRAQATSAAQEFLAALPIGGVLEHSLLEDAIIQASGAAVELSVPAADVQAAPTQMFIAGVFSFASYSGLTA